MADATIRPSDTGVPSSQYVDPRRAAGMTTQRESGLNLKKLDNRKRTIEGEGKTGAKAEGPNRLCDLAYPIIGNIPFLARTLQIAGGEHLAEVEPIYPLVRLHRICARVE
jgi:hypothetical protein